MAKPRATKKPSKKKSTPKKKVAALAPKAAKKAAPAPAKKKSAPAPKAPKRRDVFELLTIGITPPELAPDTDAHRLNASLANRSTRPSPEQIAELPWLAQDQAYRAGYYLLTHGLRQHADHPELEMCNVPGALLKAAQGVLNHLGDYVLNQRAFAHGEVMMLSENPLAAVGFMVVAPNARGTVHDVEVLRVVFLR
jgi:hypothetical protein